MLHRVNRALPIIVLAALAVWGVAMLGPSREPGAVAGAGPETEAVLPPPAEPLPRPQKPEPQEPAPADDDFPEDVLVESDIDRQRRGTGPTGRRQDQVEQLKKPERPRGDGRKPDEGEGYLSPEFVEYQTAYAYEARDGQWARPKEKRLRDLIRAAGLAEQVVVVNCRTTVCRIQLAVGEGEGLQQLLDVPGGASELGLSEDTPYSLRAGQLSVYGKR